MDFVKVFSFGSQPALVGVLTNYSALATKPGKKLVPLINRKFWLNKKTKKRWRCGLEVAGSSLFQQLRKMSKEEWDNDPRLAELDGAFDKILNAVERNEGLTRKEWMTSYEYGSSSSCGLSREF